MCCIKIINMINYICLLKGNCVRLGTCFRCMKFNLMDVNCNSQLNYKTTSLYISKFSFVLKFKFRFIKDKKKQTKVFWNKRLFVTKYSVVCWVNYWFFQWTNTQSGASDSLSVMWWENVNLLIKGKVILVKPFKIYIQH